MKRFKLAVLSLLALAFARPVGFCTANADAPPVLQLEDYTVPQLKELAATYSVEITSAMNKADIVAALKASPDYKPTQPLADKVEDAILGKPVEDGRPVEEQLADLRAQLAALQNAVPTAPHVVPAVSSTTDLLMKGAGVTAENVTWRIRAGLTPAQAVEVALQEKNEAAAKEAKK